MKESGKLNIKGLSKAFGVSQVSVRNWIDKGIPCERTPKGYTFDLTEAIQWREKHLEAAKQGGDGAFMAARTEKEVYRAKMAKLNFERLDETLILAKDVKKIAFEKARLLRDQLLNIPNRIAPILAAEKDSKKCHALLMGELRQCLESIAGNLNESEVKNDSNSN